MWEFVTIWRLPRRNWSDRIGHAIHWNRQAEKNRHGKLNWTVTNNNQLQFLLERYKSFYILAMQDWQIMLSNSSECKKRASTLLVFPPCRKQMLVLLPYFIETQILSLTKHVFHYTREQIICLFKARQRVSSVRLPAWFQSIQSMCALLCYEP